MWILSRVNNEDKVYLLCDKPQYTVGRNKTCDIVGEQTQSSLGRLHATLHPYEDRVEIIDTESKYGTYINEQINSNVRINPKVPVTLKDGDTVRFGFIDFTWKLEKSEIVVITSTLNDREKNNLRRDINTLGGKLVDQWSDSCTHLVLKTLTITVKVLQGLCHAIPIVKPDYFRAMLSSIRSNGTMPKVETFQPAIVERVAGNTWSLEPNIDRKRLFAGKTFVFMKSRQMEMFKGIIECGMGKCSSMDTKNWQRRCLVSPGVIVVNDSSSSTQSQVAAQTATELSDFLRSKGSRMVPESEISLAILYCSLSKFCNPNRSLKDNFENKSRTVPSTLLADNTPLNQNGSSATTSTNSINVPETIDQPNTLASTVPSNSEVINLMDDDDDIMLVQSVDYVMSMEGKNNKKRKKSTEIEEPSMKKPNLGESATLGTNPMADKSAPSAESAGAASDKSAASDKIVTSDKSVASTTKKSHRFVFPQRSTRSASKIKNSSTLEHGIESRAEGIEEMKSSESTKTNSQRDLAEKDTEKFPSEATKPNSQRDLAEKDTEKFPTDLSHIGGSQMQPRAANTSQPKWTSTQIETPKRKRTAHRPSSSIFAGNDSDSDDELFKFNNAPSVKKSRLTKGSDSDSDDNRNYPQSSGPVAPVPLRSITQPSQITPDSWLSRPEPSQTFTGSSTIRSKPKKRNDRVQNPKSNNVSAGWQIGKYTISTPPIPIPTQGWCSKDTTKSISLEDEIKKENSNGGTAVEESKWNDSIKCGIQVITKSMNLMSTNGKVFKKQSFIVPTEVIKTSKIYEF